jgi:hypothetical protein
MSLMGQSRHFGRRLATSDLPPSLCENVTINRLPLRFGERPRHTPGLASELGVGREPHEGQVRRRIGFHRTLSEDSLA